MFVFFMKREKLSNFTSFSLLSLSPLVASVALSFALSLSDKNSEGSLSVSPLSLSLSRSSDAQPRYEMFFLRNYSVPYCYLNLQLYYYYWY